MNILLFILYAAISAGALLLGFKRLPIRRGPGAGRVDGIGGRKFLHGAAFAMLLPLILKGIFCAFPRLEAGLMPIDGYAPIQRDFFLPCGILFFAVASHLVPKRSRRSVLALTIFMALVTAHLGWWRLGAPAAYSFPNTVDAEGVCYQSSSYTCAAASMVALLGQMGVESSEGEMAELSGTFPDRGASFFQVARGLRRKFENLGRYESAHLITPDVTELRSVPTPFLTGTKLSFLMDHMICVLSIDEEGVTIADPLKGLVVQSQGEFTEHWLGIVVAVSR